MAGLNTSRGSGATFRSGGGGGWGKNAAFASEEDEKNSVSGLAAALLQQHLQKMAAARGGGAVGGGETPRAKSPLFSDEFLDDPDGEDGADETLNLRRHQGRLVANGRVWCGCVVGSDAWGVRVHCFPIALHA